ncbi:peptidase S41 [Rheinheimera sp. D18]|nr:peptidase S41 [Rheinheimera sp. D18]
MVKVAAVWVALLLSSCGYAQDDTTRWQEDVDVYAKKLIEGHIDPFHTLSQERFDDEIVRISENIPHKTENEILIELMRLTRKINDGHTSFPLWGLEYDSFPLELKLFGNDLYVLSTTSQHKDLLGSKLVSINGVPSLDVIRLLSEITPFSENEFSTAVRSASYFPNAAILSGLGIVENEDDVKFVFDVQGEKRETNLESSRSPKLNARISHFNDAIFSADEKVDNNLWYGSSSDNKTVYVKFRRYTSIPKMEHFSRELLGFINKNKSENLVIDLRDNYGGDFFVGLKLAQQLVLADTINWKSGVYTLIDNVTFSAAMSNAAQFSQILNSKLVGSPTGARPSGYQDMGQFTLPNSGLEVTFSKRLYSFKDTQRDALYPDVHIETSIEDYKNAYDRQLRWVLSDIKDRGSHDNKTLQRTSR